MAKAPAPSKVAWHEPSLVEALTITGGYATKPFPVDSQKTYVNGYGEVTFVHVSKYKEWIAVCIHGKSGDRSILKRSQFFVMLQDKAKEWQNMLGGKARDAAVAADDKEDEDPMDLLDTVASETGTPQKRKSKKLQIHPV